MKRVLVLLALVSLATPLPAYAGDGCRAASCPELHLH